MPAIVGDGLALTADCPKRASRSRLETGGPVWALAVTPQTQSGEQPLQGPDQTSAVLDSFALVDAGARIGVGAVDRGRKTDVSGTLGFKREERSPRDASASWGAPVVWWVARSLRVPLCDCGMCEMMKI